MAETLLQKAERLNIKPSQQPQQKKESLLDKAQRLGIQPEAPKKEGSFLGNLARSIVRPVATLAVRPIQVVKALGGATEEEQAVNLPFVGKIETSKSGKDVVKDIGRGVETVALGLGGGAAKTAIKSGAKATLGTAVRVGAKEGAKAGAVGGFGAGLAEEGKVSDALKGAAIGTAAGGALGAAIPAVTKGVTNKLAQRAATKAEEASLLRNKIPDTQVVTKKLQNGKVVSDKAAKTALKQGVPDVDVALIKSASKKDIDKMAKMLDIRKKGLTNKRFGATNRASDVVGDTFLQQAKFIQSKNKEVGKRLGLVAQKLGGKKINPATAIESFADELGNAGITVGKGNKLNFAGSDFEGIKSAQTAINNVWNRALKVAETGDALQLHRTKSFVDEVVDYGKAAEGLSGKAQRLLKNFRRNADAILDETFPEYNKVNSEFAETIKVMNRIGEITGKKFRLDQEFADAQLGTIMRRVFSNTKSRTQLLPLLEEMQTTARKFGMKIDDDIINQASFVDTLEKLLGSDAPTSFAGGIERAANLAQEAGNVAQTLQTQGPVPAAFRAVGKGIQKARGINQENQIKALEQLLGIKPKTVFGR